MEQELADFCKQFYPNLIRNDRSIISPFELDIVIPERKLAIEFNGTYWHSMKPKGYHKMKVKLCADKGFKLIHIWEIDWINKKDEIKSMLEKELKE